MSEINVTPFVDVMLVLLIVFMVTAPLLAVGVPVDLPETQAQQLTGDNEPITVTVKASGEIFISKEAYALDDVVPTLEAIAANGYDERIYVFGDRNASYGTMMQVMGRISAAGFKRLALRTEDERDS
jgi:biopolymer transport protein TolR